MGKTVVYTEKAPKPVGPYSQGVIAEGKLLFVSGQIPIDSRTGEVIKGDIEKQTEAVLRNILAIVKEAGGSADNIVNVTVYLRSIDDYAKFNEVYEKFFSGSKPARVVVEVSNLPKGADLEISAVAVL